MPVVRFFTHVYSPLTPLTSTRSPPYRKTERSATTTRLLLRKQGCVSLFATLPAAYHLLNAPHDIGRFALCVT